MQYLALLFNELPSQGIEVPVFERGSRIPMFPLLSWL